MLKEKFLKLGLEKGQLIRVIYYIKGDKFYEEISGYVDGIKLNERESALVVCSKLRINSENKSETITVSRVDRTYLALDEILDLEILKKGDKIRANFVNVYGRYKDL